MINNWCAYFNSCLGSKQDIAFDSVGTFIPNLLDEIQKTLFEKAKKGKEEKTAVVMKWEDFVPAIERGCVVLTPFCDQAEWEDKVKVRICFL